MYMYTVVELDYVHVHSTHGCTNYIIHMQIQFMVKCTATFNEQNFPTYMYMYTKVHVYVYRYM